MWPAPRSFGSAELSLQQFDALVLGLPWQHLEQMQRITHVSSWRRAPRALGHSAADP